MSDHSLTEVIDATPWIDTHEHLVEEQQRIREGSYEITEELGDVCCIPADWTALLIGGYAIADCVSAGLPPGSLRALKQSDLGPVEKWDLVAPYVEAARISGFMRAVDLTTERLFGQTLGRDTCDEIDRACRALRKPGYYHHLLTKVANVERCQVNSLEQDPFCETASPGLLDQDIAVAGLVRGRHERAERLSGIEVGTLDDYIRVVDWCFDEYAHRAVAIKCLWAYYRPLAVGMCDTIPRSAFQRLRRHEDDLTDRRQVEDFLFRRCLDLATEAQLPVKVHLGVLGGNSDPHLRYVYASVADITPLVQEYPNTTFVLMHIGWPQQEQLLTLAKHQPNVVVDMSWMWIAAPRSASDFVERFLTAVPATKLLPFGADHVTVESVIGHAELARRGLQAALESLVGRGWTSVECAVKLVPMLMRGNAERIFPTRVALELRS